MQSRHQLQWGHFYLCPVCRIDKPLQGKQRACRKELISEVKQGVATPTWVSHTMGKSFFQPLIVVLSLQREESFIALYLHVFSTIVYFVFKRDVIFRSCSKCGACVKFLVRNLSRLIWFETSAFFPPICLEKCSCRDISHVTLSVEQLYWQLGVVSNHVHFKLSVWLRGEKTLWHIISREQQNLRPEGPGAIVWVTSCLATHGGTHVSSLIAAENTRV